MKTWSRIACMLMFVPLVVSAQYRDLDAALSNLTRGFGSGKTQAIVSGIAEGDQVQLQFPGLAGQSGFFGRDQAAYLFDTLFKKVRPSGYDQRNALKESTEGQYQIEASWTIQANGKTEARELYITLRGKNDRWSIVSVRSAGK